MSELLAAAETSACCDGQPSAPPFRARHLLVWIVVTGILLAIEATLDEVFGRIDSRVGPWTTCLLHGANLVISGAVLTAAGVLVASARSMAFRSVQPGHWLIINSAAVGVVGLLSGSLWRYAGMSASLLMASTAIMALVSAAIFYVASRHLLGDERWKTAFRVFAIMFLVAMAGMACLSLPAGRLLGVVFLLLMLPSCVLALVAAVSFLSAVVDDIRLRRNRDWLHWAGVGGVLLTTVVGTAWQIAHSLSVPW